MTQEEQVKREKRKQGKQRERLNRDMGLAQIKSHEKLTKAPEPAKKKRPAKLRVEQPLQGDGKCQPELPAKQRKASGADMASSNQQRQAPRKHKLKQAWRKENKASQ